MRGREKKEGVGAEVSVMCGEQQAATGTGSSFYSECDRDRRVELSSPLLGTNSSCRCLAWPTSLLSLTSLFPGSPGLTPDHPGFQGRLSPNSSPPPGPSSAARPGKTPAVLVCRQVQR